MSTLFRVIGYLPAIIKAIKTVEEHTNIPRAGSAKLELVLGLLTDLEPSVAEIKDVVTKIIARVVKFFNDIGEFKTTKG